MRILSVSVLSVLAASAAIAAPAPPDSWGKAGISFAQYRQDALDCGKQGYLLDISKTDDAKAFVTASKQLDSTSTGAAAPTTIDSSPGAPNMDNSVDQMVEYANQRQHIVDSVHQDERVRHIKQTLVSEVEKCLIGRGYAKFRLTDEQRKQLSKLKAGSDERKQYLYGLASDPAVLQSQKESSPQ